MAPMAVGVSDGVRASSAGSRAAGFAPPRPPALAATRLFDADVYERAALAAPRASGAASPSVFAAVDANAADVLALLDARGHARHAPRVETHRADVAHFVWKRRLLGGRHLVPTAPPSRAKDTSTVVLFEFDNFGDIGATPLFPAPLSPVALTLVPVGGLTCLWFGVRPAVEDVVEGLRNLRVLAQERQRLMRRQADLRRALDDAHTTAGAAIHLRRELLETRTRLALCRDERLNERFDRVISGLFIAPGALMTGVGTLTTPGFAASTASATAATAANLMTGFLGNSPIALYSLVNASFNFRNAVDAHRRLRCLARYDVNPLWDSGMDVNALLHRRQRALRTTSLLKGVSALGIGVGGLLTATTPIGYAVLVPFAIGRASTEYYARSRLNYSRRLYRGQEEELGRHALVNEIIYATQSHALLKTIKQKTRRRHPWGVHAPAPFNYVMRGAARVSRMGTPDLLPPPEVRVREFFVAHQRLRQQWLQRKTEIALRDRRRLAPSAADANRDAILRARLVKLDHDLASLAVRERLLRRDAEALSRQDVHAMLGAAARPWIGRVVDFFVEVELFIPFIKALQRDPVLEPVLRPAKVAYDNAGRPAFSIEARTLLLRLQQDDRVQDRAFLDAFYACVEKLLLGRTKTHFEELQREVLDMLTRRLWVGTRDALGAPSAAPMRPSARPDLRPREALS